MTNYVIPYSCTQSEYKKIFRLIFDDFEKEFNQKNDYFISVLRKNKPRSNKQNATLWAYYNQEFCNFYKHCTGENITSEQSHEIIKNNDEIYLKDWQLKTILRYKNWSYLFIKNLKLFNLVSSVVAIYFYVKNTYKIYVINKKSTTWLSTEQFQQLIENMIKFCSKFGYEIKPHDWYKYDYLYN